MCSSLDGHVVCVHLGNMDPTVEAVSTDKLGRRSGPRRKYTIADKPAMVEETHRRGASVAEVAAASGER